MKRTLKAILKWAFRGLLLVLILAAAGLVVAYFTSTNDCERYRTAAAHPMKAVVQCEYGPPGILQVREIEKPTPDDTQLLVRVHAVSVNPLDGHQLRGGWALRPFTGMRKPKNTRIGVDYAGVVEAVGKNVTQYKVGDEVFGGSAGSLAQYVCAKADRGVALKPAAVSFEQAGAVPIAGVTALQGLRDYGHVHAGSRVLINGASGGVGTFAVQIAKALGAEVTGVCSTHNLAMVKSLGADRVIDYTKDDFTKGGQQYDVIFDNVLNHTFSERRRVLTPNGICVNVGLGGAGWRSDTGLHLIRALTTPLMSKFTSQKFKFFVAQLNHADLAYLAELMQSGKVKPVLDRTYASLSDTPQALEYLEQGHAHGKVVIRVE